ncbi:hypothetical protein ACLOJK_026618 [Asimina triloba]
MFLLSTTDTLQLVVGAGEAEGWTDGAVGCVMGGGGWCWRTGRLAVAGRRRASLLEGGGGRVCGRRRLFGSSPIVVEADGAVASCGMLLAVDRGWKSSPETGRCSCSIGEDGAPELGAPASITIPPKRKAADKGKQSIVEEEWQPPAPRELRFGLVIQERSMEKRRIIDRYDIYLEETYMSVIDPFILMSLKQVRKGIWNNGVCTGINTGNDISVDSDEENIGPGVLMPIIRSPDPSVSGALVCN